MKNFIHLLSSPACIVSFDGTFVDANEWFVKSFKAESKEEILKGKLSDLIVDTQRYKAIMEYLLAGNTVHFEKILMKNSLGQYDVKVTNASVLSIEKQQIFIQIFELFLYNRLSGGHPELLLTEINKLSSQFNQSCIELLTEIFTAQNNASSENDPGSRIEHLTQRLAYKYPALSKNETTIGALYILGFSSMEIALWTGFSVTTVKESIFSICQKLNMQSRDEMVSAFLSIDFPGQPSGNHSLDMTGLTDQLTCDNN